MSFAIGCASFFEDPYVQGGAVGGVAGAATGAATGAITASLISSGDVGASALLGTAIGAPVGVLLGVTYVYYAYQGELDGNNEEIMKNHQYITRRQKEIDELREDVAIDYQTIRPDKRRRDGVYTGPTIGTYNR